MFQSMLSWPKSVKVPGIQVMLFKGYLMLTGIFFLNEGVEARFPTLLPDFQGPAVVHQTL